MKIRKVEPIEVRTADGWVIMVNRAPWSDAVEVWIGKTERGKFFSYSVKDGMLESKEIEEGASKEKPLLVVPALVWDSLAEAIRGVTPDIDKKEVDAELKATKFHLGDMRKLALGEGLKNDECKQP